MKPRLYVLLGLSVLMLSAVAEAQAPPAAKTPPQQTAPSNVGRAPQNCAPTQAVPQEGTIAPRDTTTGKANEALGDKLARSDGVLCPPAGVDPQMHAPTPDAGTTPVIPPPGSPGGDPSIRPK